MYRRKRYASVYVDNRKDLSQRWKKMTLNYCNYEKENTR
jgi:hypothetical protein